MSDQISENLVSIDQLLMTLGQSCIRTAGQIESISNSQALGSEVRYVIPQFKINVKLSFTQTGNEVKGILFWKKTEGTTSEALSEIEMQIVAVPRTTSPP